MFAHQNIVAGVKRAALDRQAVHQYAVGAVFVFDVNLPVIFDYYLCVKPAYSYVVYDYVVFRKPADAVYPFDENVGRHVFPIEFDLHRVLAFPRGFVFGRAFGPRLFGIFDRRRGRFHVCAGLPGSCRCDSAHLFPGNPGQQPFCLVEHEDVFAHRYLVTGIERTPFDGDAVYPDPVGASEVLGYILTLVEKNSEMSAADREIVYDDVA